MSTPGDKIRGLWIPKQTVSRFDQVFFFLEKNISMQMRTITIAAPSKSSRKPADPCAKGAGASAKVHWDLIKSTFSLNYR